MVKEVEPPATTISTELYVQVIKNGLTVIGEVKSICKNLPEHPFVQGRASLYAIVIVWLVIEVDSKDRNSRKCEVPLENCRK